MGFDKNKLKANLANLKQHINDFRPVELTEGNVEAVFNRCRATEKTVKVQLVTLADRDGIVAADTLYRFDEDVVTANKKTIRYLIGQLQVSCSSDDKFDLGNLIVRYDHTLWTKSEKALAMLCYLGQLSRTLSQVYINGDSHTIRTLNYNITPTLSPRDPNFPAWWETHKAEWEG